MKKFLFVLPILAIFMEGCSSSAVFKSNYDQVYSVESGLSFDEVWDKVIDYFAVNGYHISTIEKSSGIIMAAKTDLSNSYTKEDKNGNLENPNAFVVIQKGLGFSISMLRFNITGDWNVRVKESNGKTLINVNLVNIQGVLTGNKGERTAVQAKSTGVFERHLLDLLK